MLNRLHSSLTNRSLLAKGIWIVMIPLATLVLTSTSIYIVQGFQRDAAAAVVRSQAVENDVHILLGMLEDAEAGQRAYLLTGDESWLQSVHAAHLGMPAVLQRLDGLITDTAQRGQLNQMPSLIEERLAALDGVVAEARMLGRFPATVPASRFEPGRQLMTAVRTSTTAMVGRQRELVAARTARAQRVEQILLLIAGAGAAAGVAGGVLAVMIFTVGISSRVRVLTESVNCLVGGAPLPAPPGGRDEIAVLGRQLHQAAALLAARDKEVRRAHDKLDRFFTLSLDLFCVAGFDGYFKRLNPAWPDTLGWTPEELLAQPFLDFVHSDDRLATTREAKKLGQGGTTISFDNRYRCRDGTYRLLQWIAVPVIEDSQIYAVARDVTAAKEAERKTLALTEDLARRNAQLASLNHELEAFSYSVSHDLRAPLRSIDGFSQVLLEDYGDRLDGDGQEALQRVRGAAAAMGELIDALLALSRLSRIDLRTERVELSGMAETIAAELRNSQPEREAEFVIASDLVVEGDRTLLRAAVGNLLGNAWKYTQPRTPSRIEFGCLEKDGEIVYFVRDNGVGFDMTYVGKLFGAFQRLHRQTEFGGTGIGLATVQRIIHRHGGRVWAEGAVDQGATFYFTLHSPARNHMAAWENADAPASVS